MAKLPEVKRIIKEDFPDDSQETVGKLAVIINPVLESLAQAMNHSLTFDDNINSQVKDFELEVNASGKPKSSVVFNASTSTAPRGVLCIRVENLVNPTVYPAYQPFVAFSVSGKQITITAIMGLVADNKYRVRLLVFG